MDPKMGSKLISDSCGQTASRSVDRKSQTTRFYGVSFLRGKLKDEDVSGIHEGKANGILLDSQDAAMWFLLILSIIAIMSGIALALAGHLTPKKQLMNAIVSNATQTQSNVQSVLRHNHMLETFVLSGVVLLAVGIALFLAIMMTPICFTYDVRIMKRKGYELTANSDSEERIILFERQQAGDVANGNNEGSPAGCFATLHHQLRTSDVAD